MKYDIYFHNDLDGRAAAAVMLAFLRSRGDDIEHYVPVDYYLVPQWLRRNFFANHKLFKGKHNPAIVVDFLYHPKAVFWFDHHPTTFKKESWRRGFKPTKFCRYNPEYKSACHFVETSLRTGFGWRPPKHFKELVKWLDIIDGANYKSARQVIEMKEPALRLGAFIDSKSSSRMAAESLIKPLSRKSLKEVATLGSVKDAVAAVRKKLKAGTSFIRKNAKVQGKVIFIDLTKIDYVDNLKFVPYYLYPRSVYCVRLREKNRIFHLGATANPWRRSRGRIHIGELLQKYGGGGHRGAGVADFKTKKLAERAAKEVIEKLK